MGGWETPGYHGLVEGRPICSQKPEPSHISSALTSMLQDDYYSYAPKDSATGARLAHAPDNAALLVMMPTYILQPITDRKLMATRASLPTVWDNSEGCSYLPEFPSGIGPSCPQW